MVRPADLNHGLELQCCLRVREEVVVEVLDLEQARLTRCDSLSFAAVFGDLALWRFGGLALAKPLRITIKPGRGPCRDVGTFVSHLSREQFWITHGRCLSHGF